MICKGSNTGEALSWVIDVSATPLIIISLSRLIRLLEIKRRSLPGLALGRLRGSIRYVDRDDVKPITANQLKS